MNRQLLPPETTRRRFARARRWLIPVALLALIPKCGLCVLAWIGIGTALGIGGPELCGATQFPQSPANASFLLGLVVFAGGVVAPLLTRLRRTHCADGCPASGDTHYIPPT